MFSSGSLWCANLETRCCFRLFGSLLTGCLVLGLGTSGAQTSMLRHLAAICFKGRLYDCFNGRTLHCGLSLYGPVIAVKSRFCSLVFELINPE